jgi:hypothetical protein
MGSQAMSSRRSAKVIERRAPLLYSSSSSNSDSEAEPESHTPVTRKNPNTLKKISLSVSSMLEGERLERNHRARYLKKLPISHSYIKLHTTDIPETWSQEEKTCCVCLEPMAVAFLFTFNCCHKAHTHCAIRWLKTATHKTCPMCRVKLGPNT